MVLGSLWPDTSVKKVKFHSVAIESKFSKPFPVVQLKAKSLLLCEIARQFTLLCWVHQYSKLQSAFSWSFEASQGGGRVDRFSASLRKWGGNTNTLRAPNWTSKPLFAEYSHYDYHVGHRFGLCNTKTLCFWWETGFTPKTHSEITSWVSSSHLGHFSISGFLIYVVWICHLLVSYFFTTALCNLSGWLEMTIQVKMQYFKSLFVPASLYHAKIYVSRPKMDVFAQFTGEKSIFFGLDCRISSYCIAWTLPSSIFINIWWTRLC